MGAIELSLADSHGLKEKTNHEGFGENDAQRRLRRIVLGALTPLEVERKRDKDNIRRITTSGRNPETARIRKPLQNLRDAAVKRHVADEFNPIIDQIEHDYDELRGIMLRAGLSGMGLAIVFHEVQQGVRSLCDLIENDGAREVVLARSHELSHLLGGFADLVRKGERRPITASSGLCVVYLPSIGSASAGTGFDCCARGESGCRHRLRRRLWRRPRISVILHSM